MGRGERRTTGVCRAKGASFEFVTRVKSSDKKSESIELLVLKLCGGANDFLVR